MNFAHTLFALFSVCLLQVVFTADNLCFDEVKKLSEQDLCLSSRIFLKKDKALVSANPDEFVAKVKGLKCNGTEYSCGNTMSWVSEVFNGLKSQYQENKLDDYMDGGLAGYGYFTGSKIRELFESAQKLSDHLIFSMRHTGTEDHVNLNLNLN